MKYLSDSDKKAIYNEKKMIYIGPGNFISTSEINIDDDITDWNNFVNKCVEGYNLGMDDYIYELAIRNALQDFLDQFPNKTVVEKVNQIIKPIDEKFKQLLVDTDVCAWWGERNENIYKLTKEKRFWNWGIVKNAKGELLEDILENELFPYYVNKRDNK